MPKDLGEQYGELIERLYGEVPRVGIELRLNISLDESARSWLDDAETIWERLGE